MYYCALVCVHPVPVIREHFSLTLVSEVVCILIVVSLSQNPTVLCPPEYMVCFLHRLITALRSCWDEYQARSPSALCSEGAVRLGLICVFCGNFFFFFSSVLILLRVAHRCICAAPALLQWEGGLL